ncbi:Asp-tRNA(Asn)/Glu-tRNA(Gln) amidotransferase subunit GatA [Agathobaculum sp.]|uniref:Asp-tRNA(Asn)/Glu-tRNA(Gln) amidotransferase subunit GatA n=1 Tax=Agathobaculum sp. TaxID=2048138 RepID=UPI002A7F8328|nr:Asp-tRNA(Asn)/Glu-tRNA(Gln) amidotransferase subunit GatA [Agathobaculum sp.]MDY3618976.1 Asp-tRNA(Asn)/Glu-tRNA(Gln) amidotransferase subunit GatA [Agathobaculum sp.]
MALYEKTAAELSELLGKKEISALELAQDVLARTSAVEDKVQGYVTVTQETALETAKVVDEKRAAGEALSPMAGIPIAVKDNICTKGTLTTCASKMLYNFKPPYNATVVEKLAANNVVITGKANMDEFAMGSSCENSAAHPTYNPHGLNRVPGGSSGGSAAVVAAGEVPLSLGSDTGGSIRQPASFCGVVGLKPTYGAVSRYGLIAFASSLDQIGPFGRSVEDTAMLFDAITGHDPMHDSTSVKTAFEGSVRKNLNPDIKGIKIGLPKEYFGAGVTEEVRRNVMAAAETYRNLGAEVFEISLPLVEYALPVYYILSSAEASSNLARFDGVKYGYRTPNAADDLIELYVKSRSEGFGAEVQRRIMLGTYVLSSGYYDAYYKKARAAQRKIREEFAAAFEKCDVILTPVAPTTAYEIGSKTTNPLEMYAGDVCTVSVNIAGLPALVQPCGFDGNKMPVGMQLIGPRFGEQQLMNTGLAFEQASGLKNLIAAL